MSKRRTTITSIHLLNEDRAKLELMAKERMRSQSHLLRMALAFWLANGSPDVPQAFDLGPAGRTPKPKVGGEFA
jgi:hypothetical protein